MTNPFLVYTCYGGMKCITQYQGQMDGMFFLSGQTYGIIVILCLN